MTARVGRRPKAGGGLLPLKRSLALGVFLAAIPFYPVHLGWKRARLGAEWAEWGEGGGAGKGRGGGCLEGNCGAERG
jgi:hypothetical protein